MTNIDRMVREAERMPPPLSVEEMLGLAEKIKKWEVESESEHYAGEFHGKIEGITINIESSSRNSFFTNWYKITVKTSSNTLGEYKKSRGKCNPRLIQLFSDLESDYVQRCSANKEYDMKEGIKKVQQIL